jgi:hypothetical protein
MNERVAFEAWADKHWGNSAHLHKSATCGEWDAWQAAVRELHEEVRNALDSADFKQRMGQWPREL